MAFLGHQIRCVIFLQQGGKKANYGPSRGVKAAKEP